MTDGDLTVHFPHENEMQTSIFSDIFAQIESRLDHSHSRSFLHDPSTGIPSARVAAISTLDDGIIASRQFVHSLLTRRNTLLPIFLLPTEILVWVFHHLVLEEWPLTFGKGLGWIIVTHVCRHWRQVALDDSSLWAKIWGTPKGTKWVSEMLARAKNAPLDIDLTISGSGSELLLMIPPRLSHTRKIRFHGLNLRSSNARFFFNWDAPALEHLELTIPYYSTPMTFWGPSGLSLFQGHAPRLRTLSLSRVLIPWSHIPRGKLTELKITCPEKVDYPGKLNELIDLLVNCTALEILALEFCLPAQLTEFPHCQIIHLSHLLRLRLCGSVSRIMNMLKMLKIPSSTQLYFYCNSKITDVNSDGPLLSVISERFQSPTPIEFKSLIITIKCLSGTSGSSSLNITASTVPSTLQTHKACRIQRDMVNNAELVLSFNRLFRPGHSTNILEKVCKILPSSNLEFISLSAYTTLNINWVKVFSCFTSVTTMEAIGCGTSSLVQALTVPTGTNAGESTKVQPASTMTHVHPAIFPKLKFLGLIGLTFIKGEYPVSVSFDILERGLHQRMEASGVPLKLLCMWFCTINAKHVNSLKKLAQDFHLQGE